MQVFHLSFSTVFENHRKSRIQNSEQNELRFHLEWKKVHQNAEKKINLASVFLKNYSISIIQKIENSNTTFLCKFQTISKTCWDFLYVKD